MLPENPLRAAYVALNSVHINRKWSHHLRNDIPLAIHKLHSSIYCFLCTLVGSAAKIAVRI